jgi:hypothetical protein
MYKTLDTELKKVLVLRLQLKIFEQFSVSVI